MRSLKKLSLSLICILLVISFIGGQTSYVFALNEAEGKTVYENIMENKEVPPGYDLDVDPYGYGERVPFYLVKKSELMLYDPHDVGSGGGYDFSAYDELPVTTGKYISKAPLSSFSVDKGSGESYLKLNYVQMTAFDPLGSGREDHIAVIGVYGGRAYLYIYDNKGRVSTEALDLGPASWMGPTNFTSNDNTHLFNAMNFLSVTAGDYDGDGKDSLVVWICNDGLGYGLRHVAVDVTGSSSESRINVSYDVSDASKELLHDFYTKNDSDLAGKETWVDNKLSASVKTGDVNGDGIDDLVVLSYVNKLTDSYDGRERVVQMYRPYLAVSYGDGDLSAPITEKKDASAGVWNAPGTLETASAFDSCVAAGLAVGRSDGDKCDEILVAGIYNRIEGQYSGQADDPYNIDNSKLVIAVYDGKLGQRFFDTSKSTNTWTQTGFYFDDDDCWQQTAAEFVYMSGPNNPGAVFINGDLYGFENSGSQLSLLIRPEYFDHRDAGAGGSVVSNSYITSIAAGDFDGNDQGFEQVVFGIGLKTLSSDSYHFTVGMISAAEHDPITGIPGKYTSTSMDSLENDYLPYDSSFDDDFKNGTALNFIVCSADVDYDGILARFYEKGYAYSDPDVTAILQAPPYFSEIARSINSISSTTYSIKHSYTYKDSTSDDVSFGVGFAHGLTGLIGGYNLRLGYAMNWTQEFTDTLSESYTYRWSAIKNDSVVIYRTPVVLYSYQVQNDGQWNDEDVIVVSVPQAPSYTVLSLDDYNSFVDYYNKQCLKMAEETGTSEDIPQMSPVIDEKLHHEGDPYAYPRTVTGLTILQSTPQSFGVGSSSSGFDWSKEHSEAYGVKWGHGFNFDFVGSFNLGIPGLISSTLGGYASLKYMHSHATSTTTADAEGVGCTVYNLDPVALENQGIPLETARRFRFNYQMVRWDSNVLEENGRPVPVIGYLLSNIESAPPMILDLKADYVTDDKDHVHLTWSAPAADERPFDAYAIYVADKDGNMQLAGTVPADRLEYDFYGVDERIEYRFQIYTVLQENETEVLSIPSNIAYAFKEVRSIISIELTGSTELADIYTVSFSDGTKMDIDIKKGRGIVSIDPVGISADGQTVTYRITFNDHTYSDYEVKNGKDGVGIVSVEKSAGSENVNTYQIKLSNGKVFAFDVTNGVDGKDGIGIESLSINDKGELVAVLSDGTVSNLGKINDDPHVAVVGQLLRYYVDIPYSDLREVSIGGKVIDRKYYDVSVSGEGSLLTISKTVIPANASSIDVHSSTGMTSISLKDGHGIPWWILAWNALLTLACLYFIIEKSLHKGK